jgi:hypothetical protein
MAIDPIEIIFSIVLADFGTVGVDATTVIRFKITARVPDLQIPFVIFHKNMHSPMQEIPADVFKFGFTGRFVNIESKVLATNSGTHLTGNLIRFTKDKWKVILHPIDLKTTFIFG